MSDVTQEFRDKADPDQDARLALSAVAAIKRLIVERNELRDRLAAQDRELARLRRSLNNIRETYRRLTCDFVRQLQYIDGTIGDSQGPAEPAIAPRPAAPHATGASLRPQTNLATEPK
jgi:hypothetical protein